MEENSGIIGKVADHFLDAGISFSEARDMLRVVLFRKALDRTNGNICHAAVLVGIHRNHFTRELDRLDLRDLPRRIRASRRQEQLKLWRKELGMRPMHSITAA